MLPFTMEIAARDHLIGLGPLVAGIFVVLVLIGAVVVGLRVRMREPEPPKEPQRRGGAWETRDEYEDGVATDDHGPGHQDLARPQTDVQEQRDPNEVPHNGIRHLPYEFGPGTRPHEGGEGKPPERRIWDHGGSGHGTG
jgi:hypothetical protein